MGITVNLKQRIYAHRQSARFKTLKIKEVHILEKHEDVEYATLREVYWVSILDTYKNGLNLTPSGASTDFEKFNTLGMSFVVGKTWCYNPTTGKHKCIKDSSELPDGWVMGRLKTGMHGKRHSEESKKKFSDMRKGRCASVRFDNEKITELFNLYKTNPHLDNVGEWVNASKSKRISYQRAFAKKYSEKFNMTPNYIFNLLTKKSVAWDYIWWEITGKEKNVTYTNP